MNADLDDYIDQLIAERGYGKVDAGLEEVMRQDISERLQDFTSTHIPILKTF